MNISKNSTLEEWLPIKATNLWKGTIKILRVNIVTYQMLTNILYIIISSLRVPNFTTWQKHSGYTNFSLLKIFPYGLKIPFVDNSIDFICDGYHRAKTIKVYNY